MNPTAGYKQENTYYLYRVNWIQTLNNFSLLQLIQIFICCMQLIQISICCSWYKFDPTGHGRCACHKYKRHLCRQRRWHYLWGENPCPLFITSFVENNQFEKPVCLSVQSILCHQLLFVCLSNTAGQDFAQVQIKDKNLIFVRFDNI